MEYYNSNPHISKTFGSIIISTHILDYIATKASKYLYGKYLVTKMPEHLANYTVDTLREVGRQEIYPLDQGETTENLFFYWAEEEEPEIQKLDSWCRQAIKSLPTKNNNTSRADALSESMSSSMGSLAKSKVRIRSSRKATKKLPGDGNIVNNPSNIKTATVEEPQLIPLKVNKELFLEDSRTEQARKEKEESKKQKEIAMEFKRKAQEEEKQRNERIELMEKKLRDKEFTFDYEGKIMLIHKLDEATLQDDIINLDVNIKAGKIIKKNNDPTIKIDLTKPQIIKNMQMGVSSDGADVKKDIGFLPVSPPLRDNLFPKPGVKIRMVDGFFREGPVYKDPKIMSREEFFELQGEKGKHLADRLKAQKEKEAAEKKLKEEAEEKRSKAGSLLSKNLERLARMHLDTGIKIYEQDALINMLLDEAKIDPREIEAENLRRKKSREKKEKVKKKMEVENRAGEVDDVIVPYIKLPSIEVKPKPEDATPVGLHKFMVEFDKKLLNQTEYDPEEDIPVKIETSARVEFSKKRIYKENIHDPHVIKQPRDRISVGQKMLQKGDMMAINAPKVKIEDHAKSTPNLGLRPKSQSYNALPKSKPEDKTNKKVNEVKNQENKILDKKNQETKTNNGQVKKNQDSKTNDTHAKKNQENKINDSQIKRTDSNMLNAPTRSSPVKPIHGIKTLETKANENKIVSKGQ